ncbi:MAG TPA: methyltransferase domain-containing protein [Thermoplasmata archaeon]|nr:methyltransferase domain-containing protein [Thermoplasmata archaeon]
MGNPPARPAKDPPSTSPTARTRFLANDAYRAGREWLRYEGTPQRELFRELRRRFLSRHTAVTGWSVDLGAGPGRFTSALGAPESRRVALDLSREMLTFRPSPRPGTPTGPSARVDRVVGDALAPPFADGSFQAAALLGNSLGFAAEASEPMLAAAERLVTPGGTLVVEIAPGPGERSRYLARLPEGAVGRLFSAPVAAVVPRIHREGFAVEPRRHRSDSFRRWDAEALHGRWKGSGWTVLETLAVAPCLGPDPASIARIHADPKAWGHLFEVEERVGREPARWGEAAAVLIAARRTLREQN